MTAFVKFDPWAAIAATRQEFRKSPAAPADKPKTFATFAHSHAAHPKTQNLDIGNSPVTAKGPHGTKNEIPARRLAKAAKAAKADAKVAPPAAEPFPFAEALDQLESGCPDYVEAERWRQCIRDAERFLAEWGPQAEALEWSSGDLFGLHTPAAKPHPTYSRLSRYDCTGLLWGLEGRRVVALSSSTAAVACNTGSILKFRKLRT